MTPRPAEHPRLPRGPAWMALGSLDLLDAPTRIPVILSRSLAPRALEAELTRLEAAVREGAVLVGGFISHGEKAAARRFAHLPELRLIRVLPFPIAFAEPGPAAQRRIEEGSTLLLSAFREGDGRLTRSACVQVNRWVLALCGQSEAPAPSDDPAAIFL